MKEFKMVCRECGYIFYEGGIKDNQAHPCPKCSGNALKWVDAESKLSV